MWGISFDSRHLKVADRRCPTRPSCRRRLASPRPPSVPPALRRVAIVVNTAPNRNQKPRASFFLRQLRLLVSPSNGAFGEGQWIRRRPVRRVWLMSLSWPRNAPWSARLSGPSREVIGSSRTTPQCRSIDQRLSVLKRDTPTSSSQRYEDIPPLSPNRLASHR